MDQANYLYYIKENVSEHVRIYYNPYCILCKAHTGGMAVAPQVYVSVEDRSIPEVQRSKELCTEISSFLLQGWQERDISNVSCSHSPCTQLYCKAAVS